MNISLEHLELIPKVFEAIKALNLQNVITNEKRWLNSRELSDYIGYSLDSINKMVKDEVFVDGVHYYKPSKKLLFDKQEVDNWIIGLRSDRTKRNVNIVVDELLANIK
ncbi:MAG: hypothetical protein IBX43_09030 [Campylobacterales bacterium]|nr:hypothetical protein [Campylobacterales bacterium]